MSPLIPLLLLLVPAGVLADLVTGVQSDTGLPFWQWRGGGIEVRLVGRLPEQTQAFFLGRGFDPESARRFAHSCVLQTIVRNIGDRPVRYAVSRWRVHHGGTEGPPRAKAEWDRLWASRDLPRPARIAFHWALLPSPQELQPGDYNWGMTSYGLAPGSDFDLTLAWEVDGREHHARLAGVHCPEDPPEGSPAP